MNKKEKFLQDATKAVNRFYAEGPFTFAALLAVAKKCARTDTVRINPDEVLHRFSDEELVKFLQTSRADTTHCTQKNYKKLRIALNLGEIFYLDLTRFTQSQLMLVERELSIAQFEYLIESIQVQKLTQQERMTLISLVKTSQH